MKFIKSTLSLLGVLSMATVLSAETSSSSLGRELRSLNQQAAKLQQKVDALRVRLHGKRRAGSSRRFMKGAMKSVTVRTTPLFGVRSAYDASDLMINYPTMNEDLFLLQQRAHWERIARNQGISFPGARPVVLISGKVEAQALWTSGYGAGSSVGSSSANDINLSAAELDFNVPVSRWADGMISVDYENASTITGDRAYDSPLYLNRGFLTIGNLNRFPLYFSIGQMYVPFGVYSTGMVTTPTTKSLARINTRTAVLGFVHKGLYASVYGYKGATLINNNSSGEWGANLGFKPHWGALASNLGVGYVSNLADSQGMQNNALGVTGTGTQFLGFSRPTSVNANSNPENIAHRVNALNLHDSMQMGSTTFLAEYITALRSFDPLDLTYNAQGAKPKALQLELDHKFNFANKPSLVGIAYGRAWQGLALLIPQESYTAFVNTSFWKDTIESIEFRHDNGYGSSQATGGHNTTSLRLNGSNNTITGQIGIYF